MEAHFGPSVPVPVPWRLTMGHPCLCLSHGGSLWAIRACACPMAAHYGPPVPVSVLVPWRLTGPSVPVLIPWRLTGPSVPVLVSGDISVRWPAAVARAGCL